DIWLSTGYGRESAYVAIHQYAGLPYQAYFDRFESIVAEVAGRPHWGKLHSLDAGRLRPLYPRFDDFRRVRAEADPEGRFGNAYLTRVFGPTRDLRREAYGLVPRRTVSGRAPVVRVSGRCRDCRVHRLLHRGGRGTGRERLVLIPCRGKAGGECSRSG